MLHGALGCAWVGSWATNCRRLLRCQPLLPATRHSAHPPVPIRRTPPPQVANAPGAKLSAATFSRYWLNYDRGTISIGLGEPGENLCYSWTDPEPIEGIRFAGGWVGGWAGLGCDGAVWMCQLLQSAFLSRHSAR